MQAAITGTIITYNEEDHIRDCIESLRQVCDEIVVVDSLSTDRTVEIARAAGAVVDLHEYAGEGPQRRLTEERASHDWILALDADERIDDEMRDTILGLALTDAKTAYAFNRKSFVGDHWIRGPGFWPDYVTRLYNVRHAGYEQALGHAGVIAPRVEKLRGHILHYTYDDFSDWLTRLNWMTTRDARTLYERGRPASSIRPVTAAIAAAFRQMVLRGGIIRGLDGWTVGITTVLRAYMKYMKLNELHARGGAGRIADVARQRDGAAGRDQS